MSSTQNEDFELDPRIYEHYLGLLPSQCVTLQVYSATLIIKGLCRSLGPSNAECRSQICGQVIAPELKPPFQSYITHYWNPQPTNSDNVSSYLTATLLESRTTIESGTTGLRTWLASFVLSQYLIVHPGVCEKQSIVRLTLTFNQRAHQLETDFGPGIWSRFSRYHHCEPSTHLKTSCYWCCVVD